jgi:uncharacterized RDD family membrane protein YckC
LRPAGFWIRFVALLLDGIFLSVFFSILRFLGFPFEDWDDSWLVQALYAMLLPLYWSGYTIGKRIVGIRITRMGTEGDAPGFVPMLLRVLVSNLLYAITFGILIIISAFMIGLREDKRSIHDLIAGTQVVHSN